MNVLRFGKISVHQREFQKSLRAEQDDGRSGRKICVRADREESCFAERHAPVPEQFLIGDSGRNILRRDVRHEISERIGKEDLTEDFYPVRFCVPHGPGAGEVKAKERFRSLSASQSFRKTSVCEECCRRSQNIPSVKC